MDQKIRLGTRTWESVKFQGTLYDYQTPIEDYLKLYAAQYDAVEYHASFVDVPSSRTMEKLRNEVNGINKNFKFCPLIPRRISHEFPLGENHFDLKEFIGKMEILKDHLGPCILRLPETLGPTSLKVISKFAASWPKGLWLSIQLTNNDWFRKVESIDTLVKQLQGSSASILIEDRIEIPLTGERLLSTDQMIIRFHARRNLNQDEQRLALWVHRFSELRKKEIKNSFFFLYEQEEMCLTTLRQVASSLGNQTRVPSTFDVNNKQLRFHF